VRRRAAVPRGPHAQWTVWGERVPVLYKPERPKSHTIGRVRKYEAPQGLPPMFDVHPFNASLVADPAEPVLVTEGIKKADALTFAGACVIALSGVFNWRSPYGTLGDWANVWLRGRPDTVVFDSDAATNLNVLRAMRRLGRWLKAKGAKVSYCIPPSPLGAGMKIGADDFLARGGTLQQLLASSRPSLAHWEPGPDTWLMNSVLAERLEQDVMVDEFRYVHGIGWLARWLAGSLAGWSSTVAAGSRPARGVWSSVSAPTPASCWSRPPSRVPALSGRTSWPSFSTPSASGRWLVCSSAKCR